MNLGRAEAAIAAQKLHILQRFDGRTVILGIGLETVIDQVGTLRLESKTSVTLSNAKTGITRTVRLGDIRWVVDPDTRSRVGGPW